MEFSAMGFDPLDIVNISFPAPDKSICIDRSIEITAEKNEEIDICMIHKIIRSLFSLCMATDREFDEIPRKGEKFYEIEWEKYVRNFKNHFDRFLNVINKQSIVRKFVESLKIYIRIDIHYTSSRDGEAPKKDGLLNSQSSLKRHLDTIKGTHINKIIDIPGCIDSIRDFIDEMYEIDSRKIKEQKLNKDGKKDETNLGMINNSIKELVKNQKITQYPSLLYRNAYNIAVILWGWGKLDLSSFEEEIMNIDKEIYAECKQVLRKRSSNLNVNMRLYYCMYVLGLSPRIEDFKLVKTSTSIRDHKMVFDSLSEKKGWCVVDFK